MVKIKFGRAFNYFHLMVFALNGENKINRKEMSFLAIHSNHKKITPYDFSQTMGD